jgi:hypothetical protein
MKRANTFEVIPQSDEDEESPRMCWTLLPLSGTKSTTNAASTTQTQTATYGK